MSNFLNVNLDDITEQRPAPKGNYELQVTQCQLTETGENSKRPGSPMFKVILGFTDNSLNAPNIQHYITLPFEGDENASFKLLMLKRFLTLFNIPYDSAGIDLDQLGFAILGSTATVEVGLTEPNDNGDVFNTIKIPRMRNEPSGHGRGRPPGR